MRQIDPDLARAQLNERVAEQLPPEIFFSYNVRIFSASYPDLQKFLNVRGAKTSPHSAHRIVCQLAREFYKEAKDGGTADRLAIDITKGRSSTPKVNHVSGDESHWRLELELLEKVAHKIVMRLKKKQFKI